MRIYNTLAIETNHTTRRKIKIDIATKQVI